MIVRIGGEMNDIRQDIQLDGVFLDGFHGRIEEFAAVFRGVSAKKGVDPEGLFDMLGEMAQLNVDPTVRLVMNGGDMYHTWKRPVFVGLLLGAAFFIAFGGGSGTGDQSAKPETPAGDPVAAPAPAAGKAAPTSAAKAPAGWKKESGIDVWFPETESFAAGLPDISLHCGSIPIMDGETVDERIKQLLHGSPINQTPVKKCNMTGHIREAQDDYGHRHLTLTLEEAGFMTIVHFFNCRAPADSAALSHLRRRFFHYSVNSRIRPSRPSAASTPSSAGSSRAGTSSTPSGQTMS